MKERTPMKSMFLLTIITIEVSNLWIFWMIWWHYKWLSWPLSPFFFGRLACKMDGAKERVVETLRIKVKELVTLGKEPVVAVLYDFFPNLSQFMSELHGIYGILVAKVGFENLDSFLRMVFRKWMKMSVKQHVSVVLSCSLCEYWILVSYKNSTIVLTPSSVIDGLSYCNTHSNGKCMISLISFAYTKQILAAKRWRVPSS